MSVAVLLVALAATHAPLDCAQRPAACQQALSWQRSQRRRLERENHALRQHLRRVHAPTVREAALLAGQALGVSGDELYRVAGCETGHTYNPYAYNNSSGATGAWQFLAGTWNHTPFARWPRTDPFAEALATAQIVRAEGWRQWDCKP